MLAKSISALLFTVPLLAGENIALPPPESGEIQGKTAVLLWPATYATEKTYTLQPKEGCVAHLIPAQAPDRETTQPCGSWFLPDVGTYRVWMERPGYISPEPLVLRYGGDPFTGRGMSAVGAIVPSGTIRLDPGIALAPEHELRIISLSNASHKPWIRAFDRRVRDARVLSAMPAGKIVAGIFDRVTGDAISLTRVVDLPAGKTVVVTPVPPRNESDVLVVLRRPIQPTREALTLTLRAGGTTRAPDVFLHAVDAVFAVWFGADGRTATVSIESESLAHPPVTVQLRPAKVTTLRGTLQPKPKLKISVRSPTDAVFGKLEATVSGGDGSESPGRVVDLRSGEPASVLVPPTRVRVLLTADSWRMEKEVDLTDGRDGEVEFLLEPIAISGRIYLGKDAVAGRVVFQDDGRELMTAETDPSGEYRAVFWRPGMYVASVSAAADSAAPFLDPAVPVEYDATVDFHLPVNRVIVQVRDSLSGKPVPRAEIGIHSTGEHKIVGELALGQRQLADEQGRFVLPRLRPGTVRIEASAAGYERSGPRMLTIDATTEEELTIELRPAEAIRITVQLPDGSAAAGAEAAAFDALGTPLWHGETGSEGVLSIPLALLSRHLVVRHPNAASMILRAATPDQTIRLSEPAIPVVNVHTTDSSGEPVRFASLTLWLAGVRLNGSAAAFATWTAAAATDNTASWAGRNFQAAPLRILATRGTPPASIATGAYDAFAETLERPRPEITLVVTR